MGGSNGMSEPFWKTVPLDQMNESQWESLCDGCAKCCLLKLEDEDTGEIAYTKLHCTLLDAGTCQCSDYANRKAKVPDCVKLTPAGIEEIKDGKDLPNWHYLVCGDRNRVHETGNSVRGKTVSEDTVFEDDMEDFIVDWEEE